LISGAARVAPKKAVIRPALPMSFLPGISEMQMNKPHGAIQTHYAGHVFRSRLEARWAVFFDALKVEWKYEEQGYEVAGQRYLPDFFLPSLNAWCEVKGDPNGLQKDFTRMATILGPDSPLPGWIEGSSSIIVFGHVPRVEMGTFFHPLLRYGSRGIHRDWCFFAPLIDGGLSLCKTSGIVLERMLGLESDVHLEMEANDPGWVVETRFVATKKCLRPIEVAYRAASSARFEHGEVGGFIRG
jgi:hypothetical protein